MSKKKQLQLTIVSQEKELLSTSVDSLTISTEVGEITVLPEHISLFTKLTSGTAIYRQGDQEHTFVISDGFLNVHAGTTATIIVDTATDARSISVVAAQQAIEAAKKTMAESTNRRELLMAEASLKRALLEIRVAQKSRRGI